MRRDPQTWPILLALFAGSCGDSRGATSGASATVTTAATTEPDSTTGACVGLGDAAGACAVACQDCPPAEKCVISGRGEESQTACRPVPDAPREPGERCTVFGEPDSGEDDCQRGFACTAFPFFGEGRCLAFCSGAAGGPKCDPSARCIDLQGEPLCAPVCDPRQQGECEFGCRPVDLNCFGCFPMGDGGTFTCWNPPPEQNGFGLPCPFGECSEENFCAPPGRVPGCGPDTPCCTDYCDTEQPSCPEGTQCEAIFASGQAPQGLEDLGACLAPA